MPCPIRTGLCAALQASFLVFSASAALSDSWHNSPDKVLAFTMSSKIGIFIDCKQGGTRDRPDISIWSPEELEAADENGRVFFVLSATNARTVLEAISSAGPESRPSNYIYPLTGVHLSDNSVNPKTFINELKRGSLLQISYFAASPQGMQVRLPGTLTLDGSRTALEGAGC